MVQRAPQPPHSLPALMALAPSVPPIASRGTQEGLTEGLLVAVLTVVLLGGHREALVGLRLLVLLIHSCVEGREAEWRTERTAPFQSPLPVTGLANPHVPWWLLCCKVVAAWLLCHPIMTLEAPTAFLGPLEGLKRSFLDVSDLLRVRGLLWMAWLEGCTTTPIVPGLPIAPAGWIRTGGT